MESCIYTGYVRHIRHLPIKNGFRYRMFMMYLDLDELDTVFSDRLFWSAKSFNLAFLRRKDHFGDPTLSIDESVRQLVEEKTGKQADGPIRMLSHLRYFGHCFNPATFYYCFDKTGEVVQQIVVEVHNTPWGEVYCYVLDEKENKGSATKKEFHLQKEFHVSPFLPMDIEYQWSLTLPAKTIQVNMVDYHHGDRMFEATLDLKRLAISTSALATVLFLYPAMTIKVVTGIYWQALRLWLRGANFYSHPST